MEFSVSSSVYRDGLQRVVGVIPSKTTLPVLSNVLYELCGDELTLTGTDLEVSLVTTLAVKGKKNGAIALPGKIVHDILRQLPEEAVSVGIGSDLRAALRTSTGQYSIAGEGAKEYPTRPELTFDNKLSLPTADLLRMIEKTTFAVSTGEIRSSLMGVYFQLFGNEMRAVATDGHRLVKIVNRHFSADKDIGGYIVSTKALGLLQRNVGEAETVEICLSSNYIVFNLGSCTIYSRLLEGVYPDYEKVIPQENPRVLTVSREQIDASLRRVSIFANKMTQQIRLRASADGLEVIAEDVEFGKDARETLPAKLNGTDFQIGYNCTYLLDILKHLDGQEVIFRFNTPTSAGLVYPGQQLEGEELQMLVMPIKLAD